MPRPLPETKNPSPYGNRPLAKGKASIPPYNIMDRKFYRDLLFIMPGAAKDLSPEEKEVLLGYLDEFILGRVELPEDIAPLAHDILDLVANYRERIILLNQRSPDNPDEKLIEMISEAVSSIVSNWAYPPNLNTAVMMLLKILRKLTTTLAIVAASNPEMVREAHDMAQSIEE